MNSQFTAIICPKIHIPEFGRDFVGSPAFDGAQIPPIDESAQATSVTTMRKQLLVELSERFNDDLAPKCSTRSPCCQVTRTTFKPVKIDGVSE